MLTAVLCIIKSHSFSACANLSEKLTYVCVSREKNVSFLESLVYVTTGQSLSDVIYFGSGFMNIMDTVHCVKRVRIRSYSGPHFAWLGLNTKRPDVSLRIRSEYVKMRTRIIPIKNTFYTVVVLSILWNNYLSIISILRK